MNFKEDKAIYLQIVDLIYDMILNKDYAIDDRIPSVRDLAIETEVNPNTVMRSYKQLQDQNIIYNKRGIGYFIAQDAYKITHKLKKEEFINEKLPEIFRSMKNLSISIQEVEAIYHKYSNQK